jgi:hypothetical protein
MYLDLVYVDGLHVYSGLVCVLNACVFTAYSISCIRSRVYMFLIQIFRISLLVLSSITKKGEIVAI